MALDLDDIDRLTEHLSEILPAKTAELVYERMDTHVRSLVRAKLLVALSVDCENAEALARYHRLVAFGYRVMDFEAENPEGFKRILELGKKIAGREGAVSAIVNFGVALSNFHERAIALFWRGFVFGLIGLSAYGLANTGALKEMLRNLLN